MDEAARVGAEPLAQLIQSHSAFFNAKRSPRNAHGIVRVIDRTMKCAATHNHLLHQPGAGRPDAFEFGTRENAAQVQVPVQLRNRARSVSVGRSAEGGRGREWQR